MAIDDGGEGTTETGVASWRRRPTAPVEHALHVVIVWASTPGRVGEVAAVSREVVLGRGPARNEDPAPRIRFTRQRPGENHVTELLEPERLSRVQLLLTPDGDRGLRFERRGRCAVSLNGMPLDVGVAREGDVLTLLDAVTLLVERRPKVMPDAWTVPAYTATPFGYSDPFGMVGEAPYTWELRGELAALARGFDPILITGASGVGKELVANAIHGLSPAAHGKLTSRSAATLPPALFDAELFGTQRNYPNAGAPERPGLVGEADGGTLFMDEVGEIAAEQQAHLLRFLDAGEYHRLGEAKARRAKVRFLAATNRDPALLKHDFLARFARRIEVRGLEARLSDVPVFVSALVRGLAQTEPAYGRFLERVTERDGSVTVHARVHPALVEHLLRQDYTLHFRELRRLVLLSLDGSAGDRLLVTPALERELKPLAQGTEVGAEEIERALLACSGNVTHAARALGLPSRYSLYRLMKRFGLAADR
jgi:transcriptional regulator with GAF, ATPase, and Fis domain